jgi:hypothetical protein
MYVKMVIYYMMENVFKYALKELLKIQETVLIVVKIAYNVFLLVLVLFVKMDSLYTTDPV